MALFRCDAKMCNKKGVAFDKTNELSRSKKVRISFTMTDKIKKVEITICLANVLAKQD